MEGKFQSQLFGRSRPPQSADITGAGPVIEGFPKTPEVAAGTLQGFLPCLPRPVAIWQLRVPWGADETSIRLSAAQHREAQKGPEVITICLVLSGLQKAMTTIPSGCFSLRP